MAGIGAVLHCVRDNGRPALAGKIQCTRTGRGTRTLPALILLLHASPAHSLGGRIELTRQGGGRALPALMFFGEALWSGQARGYAETAASLNAGPRIELAAAAEGNATAEGELTTAAAPRPPAGSIELAAEEIAEGSGEGNLATLITLATDRRQPTAAQPADTNAVPTSLTTDSRLQAAAEGDTGGAAILDTGIELAASTGGDTGAGGGPQPPGGGTPPGGFEVIDIWSVPPVDKLQPGFKLPIATGDGRPATVTLAQLIEALKAGILL